MLLNQNQANIIIDLLEIVQDNSDSEINLKSKKVLKKLKSKNLKIDKEDVPLIKKLTQVWLHGINEEDDLELIESMELLKEI